ncbi:hypothetical protein KUTeg_024031 [Tegillarca granosa]|uniref:Uncharacterized protein n=1 Tax=Tegillarca granosa TaxID=220873 RepID=A0ABQ9DX92_TEGGR|nr:hypothetical protein KUTeg_024031 [Tegillarca granosa]
MNGGIYIKSTSTYGRPLRIWCKNTQIDETVTSYSSSIHVQFLTTSNDFGDLMFIMSYWAAPQGQVIVAPVEFGIPNFVLIVISVIVGVGFVSGAAYLYYREVKRQREIKKGVATK